MSKKTPSPKAAPKRAGNSKAHQLAELWLAMGASAQPTTAWENFINSLVDYLEGWRERSERGGNPAETEDIRQEAAILLEKGYLAGNRSLSTATASGSLDAIERGILHAVRGALKIARKRVQSQGIHQKQIEERLARHVETNPSDAPTLTPVIDDRRLIALTALDLALEHERINPRDAEIIRTRISESITQTELAKRSGVSRQAIHLREARATKVLRRIVRDMEGAAPE